MPERITPADYEELHAALAVSLGVRSSAPSIHSIVVESDEGVYLVERRDGRIVATAGVIGFGATAWVGGVTVHPHARGQRLAERLTRAAIDAAGPRETVSLLATPAGRRTYERLGFEPEGAYRTFVSTPAAPGTAPAGARVRPATPADHAAILALDRRVTGEDRSWLLSLGLASALVTDDLAGASVPLPNASRHIVASTSAAGTALLAARRGDGWRHTIPEANPAAIARLDGHVEGQGTVRMRLGKPPAVRPEAIWGTATLFCA